MKMLLEYDIELYKIDVSGYEDVGTMTKEVFQERKQKAKWKYYEKTLDSADDTGFKFKFKHGANDGTKATEPDYTFNWPYDYVSLVETIKFGADVLYKDKRPEEPVDDDTNTTNLEGI